MSILCGVIFWPASRRTTAVSVSQLMGVRFCVFRVSRRTVVVAIGCKCILRAAGIGVNGQLAEKFKRALASPALRRRVPENSSVEAVTRDQRSVSAGVMRSHALRGQRGEQVADRLDCQRRSCAAAQPVPGSSVVKLESVLRKDVSV